MIPAVRADQTLAVGNGFSFQGRLLNKRPRPDAEQDASEDTADAVQGHATAEPAQPAAQPLLSSAAFTASILSVALPPAGPRLDHPARVNGNAAAPEDSQARIKDLLV